MSGFQNMFRVLLANFLVEILPLLMVVAAVLLVFKARKGGPGSSMKHYLGICLAALPAGVFAYAVAGIAAAAIRGDGHFYSVPFGGYRLSDNAVVGISIVSWVALVFGVLAFALRPRP